MQKGFWTVTILFLACVCVSSQAASVDFVLSQRETTVGVPVNAQLNIELSDGQNYEQPTLPEVDGLSIKISPFPSTSSFMQQINGRTTSKKVVYSFACEISPTRAGEFTIPSFDVMIEGKKYSTTAVSLVANKAEGGDSQLFVEISGDAQKAYVGQQMTLTLKIYIKPFYSKRYRRQLSVSEMVTTIDFGRSKWGMFEDNIRELFQRQIVPQGTEVLRKDSEGNQRSYYLYEFERKYDTIKPGKLTGENINIVVNYPLRLVRVFGDRLRAESTPISAQASVGDIEILPVPLKGRPELYNGAVGNYEITAHALPMEVSVGDPVTLTIVVSGSGRMNELPAPDLQKLPELTQNFKVSTEPLAGVIKDGEKYFVTSIRPKNEKVNTIPSIPLVFFDPNTGKFSTVSTLPIAIKVKPVEKFVMKSVVSAAPPAEKPVEKLTETHIGIYANETEMKNLMVDSGSCLTQPVLIALAAGPALVLLGLLIKLYSQLMGSEKSRRRRNAGRAAKGVLSSAKTADDVEAAILRFVADKSGKPVAGMTRGEAVFEMRSRNWSQDVIRAADELMGECEHARYAGGGVATIDELKKKAQKCLREMEGQK